MHTPTETYLVFPIDLFRNGTPTKPRFDYLRTSPPRIDPQVYDVKINENTNTIDHTSGGLSLFQSPDFKFGQDWWVIPMGTPLPKNFILTKDLTDGQFNGHYSIRSMADIRVDTWKKALGEWAEKYAVRLSNYQKKRIRNV